MKPTTTSKTTMVVVLLLLAMVPMITAEDVPAMWMAQDGTDIDLMVNTSEDSSGANAHIHFDPGCINITDVNFTGSPWQPMEMPGWSHQGDYIALAAVNFSGVQAGEHKIATLTIDCVGSDCTSEINITQAEPVGVVVYNTTYACSDPVVDDTEIAIGDGTGATTIPITVTDGDNVGAVDITLSYDPMVVTVTGVSDGAMDCTYTNLEHVSEGWIRIGAIQGDNPGLSGDFTLLNIDFEQVTSNSQCALELSVTTFKDATPECNPLTYTTSNGMYISSKNGDANNDDVVDIADAAYIAKHVIGITGYEDINEDSADVNGDGIVDMSDSMYLTKHVIGITGYETLR